MRQFLDVKDRYPDAILFFRLGDFYEMFFEDAVLAAGLLDLTLTTRDKGKDDAIPMCGVPHHAARGYVARLTELGHKVVICEQTEDPKQAKGLVRREVVRVVTPGVVLDDEVLDPRTAPLPGRGGPGPATAGAWGLAYLDVTTGEFRAAELAGADGARRRAGPGRAARGPGRRPPTSPTAAPRPRSAGAGARPGPPHAMPAAADGAASLDAELGAGAALAGQPAGRDRGRRGPRLRPRHPAGGGAAGVPPRGLRPGRRGRPRRGRGRQPRAGRHPDRRPQAGLAAGRPRRDRDRARRPPACAAGCSIR